MFRGRLVALSVTSENATTTSDNDKQNEKDQNCTCIIESTANITGHVHCTSFVPEYSVGYAYGNARAWVFVT